MVAESACTARPTPALEAHRVGHDAGVAHGGDAHSHAEGRRLDHRVVTQVDGHVVDAGLAAVGGPEDEIPGLGGVERNQGALPVLHA